MESVSTVIPDHVTAPSLKIAMIGGGSGGHLFPAIAIAEALLRQAPDSEILFLVSQRPIDAKIMSSGNLPKDRAKVQTYIRLTSEQKPVRRISMLMESWQAWQRAGKALRDFRPDVVLGVGAFASVPGVLAASRLRIPAAIMEQNAVPGKANRVLAKRARVTMAGMPFLSQYAERWPSELIVTGTPVRSQIATLSERTIIEPTARPRLLILGGSQGSHSVNRLVLEAFADERCVPSDWHIVHQTGESQVREVAAQYDRRGRTATVLSFIPDLCQQLAQATLVISRSGAGTLQELACAGLPSILIPFSRSASQHQLMNARQMSAAGAAELVEETDEDAGKQLRLLINRFVGDPDLRARFSRNIRKFARPNAAAECVSILMRIADRAE